MSFQFQEMFPLAHDSTTPYKQLTTDHVAVTEFRGRRVLEVDGAALTLLAKQAYRDVSHLLRPGHLAQLRGVAAGESHIVTVWADQTGADEIERAQLKKITPPRRKWNPRRSAG